MGPTKNNFLSCDKLWRSLTKYHGWSVQSKQQDVHEAIILMFDAVANETNDHKLCGFGLSGQLPVEDIKLTEKFHSASGSVMAQFPFKSLISSTLQCLRCSALRKPIQVENCLSISLYPSFAQSIPPFQRLFLTELLRKHFEGELLTEVSCD